MGSVRGEIPDEPWWTYTGTKLETADTAKGSLQLTGTPLLGSLRERLVATVIPANLKVPRLTGLYSSSSGDADAQAVAVQDPSRGKTSNLKRNSKQRQSGIHAR